MDSHLPGYVPQSRAASLLGLSVSEISRMSNEMGIGHLERRGKEEERFFTYQELRQICILATREHALTH